MLASDALSQQTNGRLNQQLDAELQQRANAIANDVGTRSAADGAAGFDANVLAQLNASDLMQDQYLDKRSGAIDGYLNMSRKTQRDIQSIDARTATSRQQRATQASQIQQRYEQRTMDFRMANPVHRGSAPLFDYDSALAADNAMWGDGKRRSADLSQLRQNIMNGPTGPSNAIETELNLSLNVPIVELGGGGGFTVDSYGRMTFSIDGLFSTTTNLSLSVNAQLSKLKGFGATSEDLGTGFSISTTADVTLTDKIFDLSDRIKDMGPLSKAAKVFLKAKPAELYAGREYGWTQTKMPWEQGAENQYRFEGSYVGFAAGWKNVYKIDKSTIENSPILGFVDKHLTLGKTYETAAGITYDKPNVFGRVVYHAFDFFSR